MPPTPGSPATPPATTGVLLEQGPPTIHLSVPNTDYRLYLTVKKPVPAELGDRVSGVIRATAKRVDVIPSGGRFVEPIYGRPRRVQGLIVGGNVADNTIYVRCGPTMVCRLSDPRQKTGDFATGQMVTFDVESRSTFEPVAVEGHEPPAPSREAGTLEPNP